MSIWSSWPLIGFDHFSRSRRAAGGQVRSYARGFSNHYPTKDGEYEQPAGVQLAAIPAWCVPGHDGDESIDHVGPWLRLSVESVKHDFFDGGKPTGEHEFADVVMDERAVQALVEQLREWLTTRKARPRRRVRTVKPVGGVL